MKDSNIFQLTVLGLFFVAALVGVILFAGFRAVPPEGAFAHEVVLWGTIDERDMGELIKATADRLGEAAFRVRYVEKRHEAFERDLLEALASGVGPDLILIPQDEILTYANKLRVIPFEFYPERAFKDTFIEEGELLLTSKGLLGLPFSIDPLVLYWNRTTFASAGLVEPPRFWDEYFALARDLTVRNEAGTIVRSAVALGEFANVTNAKDIFAALVFQAGNPIVERDEHNRPVSVLAASGSDRLLSPAEAALRFYIDFSNPVKPTYSWNRSLPTSENVFLAGNLATYLGFASEVPGLRAKNSNLNFDVAQLPQARDTGVRATFGRMQALAVTLSTAFGNDAWLAAQILTSAETLKLWSEISLLPPVRRDLLVAKPADDARAAIFYDAALQSRGWLDPRPRQSDAVFRDMVEAAVSGRERISGAVFRAHGELSVLLQGRQ
ncbi:MAG: extracellular solute-binding protein [bacterium]|nr:extracellular solute-binding protein [bacterium]MDZ4284247.1 extracellular solute-binding protein [Patescibacteria group bacterium]